MNRLPVLLAEPAITELERIADYIAEISGSPSLARRYVERIRERCLSIGFVPRGGRSRDDLLPGLRTFPFERSALICYLVADDHVLITNVFHGGRDVAAFFRSEPHNSADD